MTTGAPNDPDTKAAELLLYVAQRTELDETAGSVKYNKILYFGELAHMRKVGQPITGVEYQKNPMGPTLKRMVPIVTHLLDSDSAVEVEREYYGRSQKRLIALRPPDLSAFSGEEIAAVDVMIQQLWGKSAKEISDLSHDDLGWRAVEDGHTIPLSMAFINTDGVVTEKMRQRAKQLVADLNP